MELDNLKHIWKEYTAQDAVDNQYNPENIHELMRGKSKHVIAKIEGNLRSEIYITLGTLLFFLAIPFVMKGAILKIVLGLWAFLCVIYLLFSYQKYTLIQKLQISDENVKSTLQQLVRHLEKYVSIYFWSNITLIPLVHITVFSLLHFWNNALITNLDNSSVRIFLIIYVLASTAWMIWFFKWFLVRLYGNYIDQLKQYLVDLGE